MLQGVHGDQTTDLMNRLKLFEINNDEYVKVSIAPSRANTSDTKSPTKGGTSIMWAKRNFQNLKPSHRGVFFDYQFDPGTPKKILNPDIQKSSQSAICEATGSLTSSFCFRHLGYCNIAYMDGHVGDMTFKDTSILINNGHDFSKIPETNNGIKWAENTYQTKYPFGPRPGNIRAGFTTGEYENTFVIYR